jgi:hypothetical protein
MYVQALDSPLSSSKLSFGLELATGLPGQPVIFRAEALLKLAAAPERHHGGCQDRDHDDGHNDDDDGHG